MGKHGKYLFYIKTSVMSVLLACVPGGHAYADDSQIILSAVEVEISADCINDSVADLSVGEIVDNDYDIRLRWNGDTLVDLTTIDMRCDFTCKGDSLLLTMVETGSDARVFSDPVQMNASGEFMSTIKPWGGVDGKSAGRSNNYIAESILINSEGDTLNTLMNKQLFVSTLYFPSDNPYFSKIAVKELRSYYLRDTPFPVAVVSVTSYYDSEYKGIGGNVLAIDLIAERRNLSAANGIYKNKALVHLSPFSRMAKGQQAPKYDSHSTSRPGASEPTVDIIYSDNSIRINTIAAHYDATCSYSVVVSDVRGIVWYAGDFRDSTVIPTSSYPSGEYQITVSDGINAHTEKLTF